MEKNSLEWLKKEIQKDELQLRNHKKNIISQIKKGGVEGILKRPSKIKIIIPSNSYLSLLREIEEFVRVKVDRNQETISITISSVEFIFEKEN